METNRPPATTSMDPNPKTFPVLSYVMSRLPTLRHPSSPSACQPPHAMHDIEQPPPPPPSQSSASTTSDPLIEKMPHLKDPKVIAAMSAAVTEIAQTRSVLKALGERPDHETIDVAKSKLSELESDAANQLEEIALSPKEADQEADEKKARVEREMTMYRAIIQVDEMHEAYKKLLRGAEEKLMRIYDRAVSEAEAEAEEAAEEVDEEVVRVLKEAETVKAVDLSGRKLRVLPEVIGKLGLVVNLNLSSNQLQSLPDSICGLENLEEFNLSSNSLKSLPDSIGLLRKLRILNVSGNKLTALPDTICQCRSLVELDAGFNNLGYLPTNIGELTNLEKLSIQYNKIRSLPTSIGDMKSLQYLDIHFNELHSIPHSFGKLKNLVTLNLCGNFSDLKELPETFGELESLEELDLSNNQIHALPDTFGMLDKLKKFCIEQNPVFVPPVEVIKEGVENVKKFMAKRLMDLLMEEEKSKKGMNDENEAGWLKRSVSKLGGVVSTVSEYLGSPRSPRDPLLDLER